MGLRSSGWGSSVSKFRQIADKSLFYLKFSKKELIFEMGRFMQISAQNRRKISWFQENFKIE